MVYIHNSKLKVFDISSKPIDPVEIENKYAIFSTKKNDVIFNNISNMNVIFCGGNIRDFGQNVYNLGKNEFVGYISCEQKKKIEISSNLVFKIKDSNNLGLFAVLPYASLVMKILRKLNPQLGQNFLIIGLNFFSILLMKMLKLSGININILKNENDSNYWDKFTDIKNNILNNLNEAIYAFKNIDIDGLILFSDLNIDLNEFLNKVYFKQKININQLSKYDVGYNDPDYVRGIKYPYSYIRWDYRENLRYFISIVENKTIDLTFIEFITYNLESFDDLNKFFKNMNENRLLLIKFPD